LYPPTQPLSLTAEKAFAGKGLPLADSPRAHSRAGWSCQSKKLHFKWLPGRQCQTFAEDVLRRKKITPPTHFYANNNIFDLYSLYAS